MSNELEKSFVRIFSAKKDILGCGFLISENWIVTCDHIINAFETSNDGKEEAVIKIDFPFIEDKSLFECNVASRYGEEDIAFLRLDCKAPKSAQHANLVFSNEFRDHKAWTYGFPEKHNVGVNVKGNLVAKATNGRIQFDGGNNSGYWIKKGFSGAPVWDDALKGFIGMVAASNTNPSIKSAFLIPSDLLGKKWSDFKKESSDLPELIVNNKNSLSIKLVNVPTLHESYVQRSEEIRKLKSILLREETREGVLVASAIHGAGGIGKTILATLIVNDHNVKEHFHDGIFWVTLGQTPDILSLLNLWIHALGDTNFKPTTNEAASAYLRTMMQEKHVLLVVDDAWEADHVKYFKVGGPFCKLLITTRDALIAKELDISLYELDVMKSSQALELLSNNLKRKLQGKEREKALDLAEIVGYLPLALKLSAVQILEGIPWDDLVKELKAEVANLRALDIGYPDDGINSRDLSIRACFKLSLRRLPDSICSCFPFFGALPEDVIINHKMMATIWKDSPLSAKKKLIYLKDKALLTASNTCFDDGNKSYRIHDLLHDLACNLIQEPIIPEKNDISGLGITLNEAHEIVLSRYFEKVEANLWHTLPDDEYIYDHLTWHMEKSQLFNKIDELLREETLEKKNGWYQTRISKGQISGFIEDVSRALKLKESEYENAKTKGELISVIGVQVRYSMIISSINSLSANIHAELMTTLVDKAIWTDLQGYAYSQHILIPYQRAKAMLYLYKRIPSEYRKEALERAWMAAKQISDYKCKLTTLAKIASYFDESGRNEIITEILSIINSVENRGVRIKLTTEVVSIFPSPLNEKIIQELIEISNQISDDDERLDLLVKIVKLTSDDPSSAKYKIITEILGKLNQKDKSEKSDIIKKRIITELVSCLNSSIDMDAFEMILDTSRYIWRERIRAETLSKIYSSFPESKHHEIIKDAIEASRELSMDSLDKKARALSSISINFPSPIYEEVRNEALDVSTEILDIKVRIGTLITIFRNSQKYDRESIFYEIVELMQKVNYNTKVKYLERLIDSISDSEEKIVNILIELIFKIDDKQLRKKLVFKIICNLKDFNEKQIIEKTIISLDIQKDEDKYIFLSELFCDLLKTDNIKLLKYVASIFPEENLIHEIEKAEKILDIQEKDSTLFKLTLCLPFSMADKSLNIAYNISNEIYKDHIFRNVYSQLSKQKLISELKSTRHINDKESQAILLVRLSPYLQKSTMIEALSVVNNIPEIKNRVKLLAEVVFDLPDSTKMDVITQIIKLSRSLSDYGSRILTDLGNKSEGALKIDLFKESLNLARKIDDPYKKEMVLIDVISNLPDSMIEEALEIISDFKYTNMSMQALIKIIPKMSESFVKKRVNNAHDHKKITKISGKDYFLKCLASEFITKQIPKDNKKLDEFWSSIDKNNKFRFIIEIALRLPLSMRDKALEFVMEEINLSSDKIFNARTLIYINSKFPKSVNDELVHESINNAFEAVDNTDNSEYKIKIKSELAVNLQTPEKTEVLYKIISESLQITDIEQRVKVLMEIVTNFPEIVDNNLLKEISRAVFKIKDPESKIKNLAILSTYMPSPLKEKTIESAIELTNRIIDHRYKAKILVEMSSCFVELPREFIYKIWTESIHLLSSSTRESMLLSLSMLLPLIYKLGGVNAIEDTFISVKDASRWWP